MLHIFSLPPFYTNMFHLPTADDPVPSISATNPKFWPFFKDTLGALDGSHLHSSPLHQNEHSAETAKDSSPKLSLCLLISLFCLFTHIWVGRICNPMLVFMKRLFDRFIDPCWEILPCWCWLSSMSRTFGPIIMVLDITLLNGAVQILGMKFSLSIVYINSYIG